MRGVIDGGVEISSAPSPQKLSDLEKTQAELRETFNAAEKFRRELEFLQKGGDPLDLKFENATSVSLQSTSLADQHHEQFLTSEVKGSFAVTASPHGDSIESSGRLGAPSVGEPNSADNLMLFDGDNKIRETAKRSLHPRMNSITPSDVALDFPKKSYKRRIRSRPNRDGARSSSTSRDAKGLVHDADNQDQKYLSNSNSKPKSPASFKNSASNSRVDVKLNGNQTQKSTFCPAYGPVDQSLTSDTRETLLALCSVEPGSVGLVEQKTSSGSEHPPSIDTQTVTKGFDSKLSCSRTNHSLDANNENVLGTSPRNVNSDGTVPRNVNSDGTVPRNVNSNGTVELNLTLREASGMEANDASMVKDDKISNITNDTSSPCPPNINDNNSTVQEEEVLKGSESAMQHESTLPHMCSIDDAEQNACSQNNLKQATKEHEDSILEDARIIEEKRRRIARLSVGIFPSESYHRSHWHFVLEEMSWLANDFAQERIWKAAAAAQISLRAAYNSRVRFQQQKLIWKQKEVSNTLAKAVMEFWHTVQVNCDGLELEGPKNDIKLLLRQYGMRFLEYNNSRAQYSSAQAPMTPDRISDLGTVDISWDDNLTEENLFYTVTSGAVEAYRKSIESHLLQSERTDSSMQEGMDASGYDAVTENGTLEDYVEETSTYYSSKATQKKKIHFGSYGPKSYEMGPDFSSMQPLERNIGSQPSVLSGKRPTSNINSSIPTKRVRTASRPRFTGTSGIIQAANRADASSGDTNSFQDEQSSLHGGSHIPNNMEVESVGDYEKQLHFDQTEVSNRPKKKKKTKHHGSMSDRWQLDSNYQNDQKDHSKRRLDSRQYDSNGNSVASQTSNMPSQNKFMKLLVRDRGRKTKSLKTPSGQQGSGNPWSLFEDQALVVLVHDMGPNWELISDAINNILQFKCISRNSKECKERHKILMDNSSGDGADSAEDSGSSQPYSSTLPGIPEGSARQLFQQLQGPMEENSLKFHFEKIIMIWQKPHYRKTQRDNQDPKQLQQPHGSHALALSQVYPNNLNGGPVLTPLDLCETISPSPEFIPMGYQGPHTGGLPTPNSGNVASMVPGSSPASSLPGSSASGPLSPSLREGRHGIPRAGSLSIDGQHRMQQFNQMSARNMQQTSLPPGSHSGTDRGVRMLPGGANMGVVNGMNRNMTMARPPFQGSVSPSILNSGAGAGAGSGQGNSVRPREALNMTRPNQNSDNQRQNSAPDLQNSPQPPVQSFQQSPHMPQHHLQGPPNHPAYGMRYMNEKQLHQQRLLQQHFGTSNSVIPHGKQPQQSQIPVSSPQSSTQVQSQSSQQKHPVPPPHGLVRNPQTGANHTVKPPPRHPPFQPLARQHAAKVVKNTPVDSSVMNGFSGSQSVAEKVGQLQQKRYPGQQLPSSSKQHLHQKSKKSVNQIPTTAAEKTIQNRKESTSDPPESNSGGTVGEHPGPAVNNGVVHKQSSSDILPKSDAVQWQQQPSS